MKNHDKIYIKDNPDLIKQWHFEKKNNLSPSELTLGSGKKAWWKCELGHEWEDTILHRSNGRNCPYCSNHRVLIGYNDLATTNPKLANEWNHEKNTDISIKKITAGSHKKVWWKCAKGHEWQSVVKERQQGNDCPYCSNKRILAGYNDLATTNPNLIREWNYERNTEITPQQISSGSSKKVWWRCEHGHEYLASISQRNKGNGCPYCANKKIIKGYNDLATIHPEIASEWCYEKNGSMTPYNSSPASGKMVWWKCDKGHEWQTPILNRHQGSGCPICSNQEILKGYNDLATTSPWLALEWNHKKNKDLNPTQVSSGSGKKVWWIGQCGHEWQAPISNRSQGTGCPICAKG